jgi:hypothetical protein
VVVQVVLVLKKEVTNTINSAGQTDDVGNYRQVWNSALFACLLAILL